MAEKLRLDKWLWHGRFFKTRSLAAAHVAAGDVRVNGTRTEKRSHMVGAGDVLTFALGDVVRVIRIEALGASAARRPRRRLFILTCPRLSRDRATILRKTRHLREKVARQSVIVAYLIFLGRGPLNDRPC